MAKKCQKNNAEREDMVARNYQNNIDQNKENQFMMGKHDQEKKNSEPLNQSNNSAADGESPFC